MDILSNMVEKLADSPIVQKAMKDFGEIREGIIQAMQHFNTRFDTQESKLDKVVFILEHPSTMAPAGEHRIDQVLLDKAVLPCLWAGCTNMAIHDHGDGIPVSATLHKQLEEPVRQMEEVSHG